MLIFHILSIELAAAVDYINTRRLKQDDPCIIDLIRRHHLNRPSPLDVPYNLTHPETKEPSAGQVGVVLPMFNNKVSILT